MSFPRKILAAALAIAFLGAGCTTTAPPIAPPGLGQAIEPAWHESGDGVMRYETSYGQGSSLGILRIYQFPSTGWQWSFAHSTSAASVREWADRIPDASVLVNGVYFHEDNLPSGAFVSHGEYIGSRAFDADKSALIVLAPAPRIVDLTKEPKALEQATEAAQTFPYLIKNTSKAITEDSGKLAERSFVGTDTQGRFYVGVAINASLSLYELAVLLADQPIQWQDAVNLDGGPSTGIFVDLPNENRSRTSLAPVPNVVVGRTTSSASQP